MKYLYSYESRLYSSNVKKGKEYGRQLIFHI